MMAADCGVSELNNNTAEQLGGRLLGGCMEVQ